MRWCAEFLGPLALCALCLASMALGSRAVFMLDHDAGGWLVLGWLMTLPALMATLRKVTWGRLLLHALLLVVVASVWYQTTRQAHWTVRAEVDTTTGPWNLARQEGRVLPSLAPARIPLRVVDDSPAGVDKERDSVRITWQHPDSTIVLIAPLAECYQLRGRGLPDERPVPWAMLLLGAMVLVAFTDHLLRWRPWRHRPLEVLTHLPHGPAAWAVIGLLVAAVKHGPDRWLGNLWITRGDDWYYLARGVESILAGNVFLNPMPDSTEFWSFGYMYVVALVHVLAGPALSAVYAVQQGYHYLVAAALMALLPHGRNAIRLAVALGAVLFVEADLNRQYGWLLMGDTLALPLLLGLVIGLVRGLPAWGTGLLGGALFLARPEFLPIGALAAWVVAGRAGARRRDVLWHLALWAVCVLIYMVRKSIVHGDLLPLPPHAQQGHAWAFSEPFFAQPLGKQVMALLGWFPALHPWMAIRWHWFAVHALFFAALVFATLRHLWDRPMAFVLAAWLVVFAGRLAAPSIALYGHRHSLALIALELAFVLLVAGRWAPLLKEGAPAAGPPAPP